MEIYIVFADTKTVLSKSISLFTDYPYSHCSLAFDSRLTEVYSFGRKRPANPFIGGFTKEDLNHPFFLRSECELFKCTVSETDGQQIRRMIRSVEENQHLYGYNFLGLFGVLLQKEIVREHRFFCVQFVAEALRAGGVRVAAKPAGLLRPEDIARSHELELVYSGPLSAYLSAAAVI
ncbi:hypothetical protein [Indiicoccus explosivorum]|uniref:hypothetical protein n=1 Tax=Indiicoccus explosivorum TaxID=1917864 RepID=UPI000B44940A|nr:hypothetical protein [Indiicoccus explosivorum]